jgi:hypothetical protein
MVEILDGATLRRLLLERYSKNPKNWNFTISPARSDGFFDALVSSPGEAYQLKIDSIFKPTPLMLGTRVDVDHSKFNPSSSVSYGYRKLDREILMRLLSTLENAEKGDPLESILGPLDPIVPAKNGSYAQGPFVFTNEKITNHLSAGQGVLDDKLSAELRKLMRAKYPAYG